MRLIVVDPRLLVRALTHHDSQEAKLLSLLIYGVVCVRTRALREEYDELHRAVGGSVALRKLAKLHACVERRLACARRQKARIERALDQYIPVQLLLVTSPPLRQELRDIARAAQANGSPHVRPHRVNLEIARCTWRSVTQIDPPPPYLGSSTPRAYLIHTAVVGGADCLITDDEALVLPDNTSHCDPTTRRSVHPYTLVDFCQEQLPSQIDFDAIDAPAVFRAAHVPRRKS